MNFQDLDAQAQWELTALNALEQAAQANAIIAKAIADLIENPAKPEELAAELIGTLIWIGNFVGETQRRMALDLCRMRKLTDQREKEQP